MEIFTFEDLIQYGKDNGANIVDEMPWSFEFHGIPVSHENDECYLIGPMGNKFTPNDIIKIKDDELFIVPNGKLV